MSYIPMPPQGSDDPASYAYLELQDLARALSESQEFVPLQILHVEPERPRDGMIVYADGTDWDPGDGVGPYCRISGSWIFLGGSGGGGSLTDGDKGDITVTASGLTWTIDNDVVTYAKMQNVSAASKLVGRGSAAGSGDPQEITLGSGLSMSTTTLNVAAAGSNTEIQFNSSGALGASAELKLDQSFGPDLKVTNTVSGKPANISVWNQFSNNATVAVQSNTIYGQLAASSAGITLGALYDLSISTGSDAGSTVYPRMVFDEDGVDAVMQTPSDTNKPVRLTCAASTSDKAGFRITPGATITSGQGNGDIWTDAVGLYVHYNGTDYQIVAW